MMPDERLEAGQMFTDFAQIGAGVRDLDSWLDAPSR